MHSPSCSSVRRHCDASAVGYCVGVPCRQHSGRASRWDGLVLVMAHRCSVPPAESHHPPHYPLPNARRGPSLGFETCSGRALVMKEIRP